MVCVGLGLEVTLVALLGGGGEALSPWREVWSSFARCESFRAVSWRRAPCLRRGVAFPFARACLDFEALERGLRGDGTIAAVAGAAIAADDDVGWVNRGFGERGGVASWDEVRRSTEERTLVVNSAGLAFPSVAAPCVDALDAFGFPVGANIYASRPSIATSAPPHSDAQDVFVVQTCGSKRWRVWDPPDATLDPEEDPFSLGKGRPCDVRPLRCVLDETLYEGDVLYVPAGAPHATATEANASLHVTFGVVCARGWGLDVDAARRLARAAPPEDDDPLDDPVVVRSLAIDLARALERPLPLGFLASDDDDDDADAVFSALAADSPLSAYRRDFGHRDPTRENVRAALRRLRTHVRALLAEQRRAYDETAAAARRGDDRETYADRLDAHSATLAAIIDDLFRVVVAPPDVGLPRTAPPSPGSTGPAPEPRPPTRPTTRGFGAAAPRASRDPRNRPAKQKKRR